MIGPADGDGGGDRPEPGGSMVAVAVLGGLGVLGLAYLMVAVLFVSALAGVVLTQHTSCGPASAGTAGPALRSVPPGRALNVTVASWNTYRYNTAAKVAAGIRTITRYADVIGLQELTPGSRRRAVAGMLGSQYGISAGNNAVKIVWRADRYRLLAQRSVHVFGRRHVENGVAGRTLGPKSYQWVQLQDRRTGAAFVVLNYHVVPSIEAHHRPDTRKPRRLQLADLQVRSAAAEARRIATSTPITPTTMPVAVTGDHNMADPSPWLEGRLNPHGLQSSYQRLGATQRGTHGRRRIDYVWSTSGWTPTGQAVLRGGGRAFSGSDHRPILVRLSNRTAGPGTSPMFWISGMSRHEPSISSTASSTAARATNRAGSLAAAAGVCSPSTGDPPAMVTDRGPLDLTRCRPTRNRSEAVLTADARLTLRCVAGRWPALTDGIGTYPGHQPSMAQAIDIMLPRWQTPAGQRLGHEVAAWVRAHARDLGVQYVIYRSRIWNVERAGEGWRACGSAAAHCYAGPDPTAGHQDHVHVSVYGNRATSTTTTTTTSITQRR